MVVHKFVLELGEIQDVPIQPGGKGVLTAGIDGSGKLCLWAEVNPSFESTALVSVYIVPTGGTVPENTKYLATVLQGCFVWHIYLGEHPTN